MNYNEALNFIIAKQGLGIMPGLLRIEALLEKMGNPQNKLKIIHIAGTNGKGTVASTLAQSLIDNGFKVGLFTSPWLEDYREQITVNGEYIPKADFAKYVTEFGAEDATEFEIVTAIMYKYFADVNVDYAVVECGLGGKGDSTNAINTPILSVITSVSMDHTNFLGNTLESIATEKAGIIKQNGTVILYPNPKCESVFENRCRETNSKLIKADDKGDFKQNNLETVNACLKVLGINADVNLKKLPARQEYIAENIMLDGAHNADGALALAKYLPTKKITAVIGMMRDKDVEFYLKTIAPYCKKIIATAPSNPRSMNADELGKFASKYCDDVISIANPHDAINEAKKDFKFLLVCGSFYLARDIRKDLI